MSIVRKGIHGHPLILMKNIQAENIPDQGKENDQKGREGLDEIKTQGRDTQTSENVKENQTKLQGPNFTPSRKAMSTFLYKVFPINIKTEILP